MTSSGGRTNATADARLDETGKGRRRLSIRLSPLCLCGCHCLVSAATRCECVDDALDIAQDLVVPEANDAIAFALQPRCPLGIGGIHRSAESEASTRASAPHRLNVCAAGWRDQYSCAQSG